MYDKGVSIKKLILLPVSFFGLLLLAFFLSGNPFNISTQAQSLPAQGELGTSEVSEQDAQKAQDYFYPREQKNMESLSRISVPTPPPGYKQPSIRKVHPILFVAQDKTVLPEHQPAINSTMQLIRRWYSGPLEQNNLGYTFEVANVAVYNAPFPFSHYQCGRAWCAPDEWIDLDLNVVHALQDAGYPVLLPGFIHEIFVIGGGGWASAWCYPDCPVWPDPGPSSETGVAVVGDWALDAISTGPNPDCVVQMGSACNKYPQQGAIAHELGHTFGLYHANDDPRSLMRNWWDFPYVTLIGEPKNDEIRVVRSNQFIGSRVCTHDSQVIRSNMPSTVTKSLPDAPNKFFISFTFNNYGWCRWTPTTFNTFLVKDNVWGKRRANVLSNVYPAQEYRFRFQLTAPTTVGRYYSLWKMRKSTTFFGAQVGKQIRVTNP